MGVRALTIAFSHKLPPDSQSVFDFEAPMRVSVAGEGSFHNQNNALLLIA